MARAGGLALPTITEDRALGDAKIQRSLRFNRDDAPYLQTTLGNSNVDKPVQTLSHSVTGFLHENARNSLVFVQF